MRKVALIGPGAIGGTFAAWLGENPEVDLTICARTPFAELVVDVPGDRTLRSRPRVLVDPAEAQPVDWILSVTKTYDTDSASRWIKPLSGAETKLAVIQNGVEQVARFAPIFTSERILPVIVDIPAERSAPGHIVQRRHGDIHAPAGSLGESFRALFEGTELTPSLTDDFLTAAWRKLALNSAGIVHALTLKPAKVVQNEGAARAMRSICQETIAVGRAEGAKLGDHVADEVVERLRQSAPESVNSFLADRLARRPMEIDARNGVVVRLGRKHGIPTPLTEMAVALLEAAIE
jgi:2-dehydropantoate 2-reductase